MEGNVLTQDSKHMVEILNKSFPSVFTVENPRSISECQTPPRGITPLEIGPINERDVQKYLDKLEKNKSTGPDALSPRLLKELKQQILKPLTDIYNLSLQQNTDPEDWKQAKEKPIFKKGEKSEVLNYGPINLTSVAGKILEIIRDKLVKFF